MANFERKEHRNESKSGAFGIPNWLETLQHSDYYVSEQLLPILLMMILMFGCVCCAFCFSKVVPTLEFAEFFNLNNIFFYRFERRSTAPSALTKGKRRLVQSLRRIQKVLGSFIRQKVHGAPSDPAAQLMLSSFNSEALPNYLDETEVLESRGSFFYSADYGSFDMTTSQITTINEEDDDGVAL